MFIAQQYTIHKIKSRLFILMHDHLIIHRSTLKICVRDSIQGLKERGEYLKLSPEQIEWMEGYKNNNILQSYYASRQERKELIRKELREYQKNT